MNCWLFDDAKVAVLVFGADGVHAAELLDRPAEVVPYRRIRDRAWDAAIPYLDWVASAAP